VKLDSCYIFDEEQLENVVVFRCVFFKMADMFVAALE